MGSAARCSVRIERTPYPSPTALQRMRVDHRCTDVLVPQDLLHRSKVVKLCLNRRIARRRVQAV